MSTTLIEVRPAKAADAVAVASTHDEAWRAAYQGIIPGAELEKLINRRGPHWWVSAIRKGSRVSVLVFGDKVAGYANYGRNRARSLHFEGEIYELYLRPIDHVLGRGMRNHRQAKRALARRAKQYRMRCDMRIGRRHQPLLFSVRLAFGALCAEPGLRRCGLRADHSKQQQSQKPLERLH